MKATTIKVEGDLLAQLETQKPATQSLSAFARSILRRELMRRRLADPATRYSAFLDAHPAERAWLAEWGSADLASTR
jgi:hypothetical protein